MERMISPARGLVSMDACGVRVVDGPKVAAVRAAMPPKADVAELADVLGLLGRVSYRAASQMKMLRKIAPPRKTRASLS